jgi:hypothetical protein
MLARLLKPLKIISGRQYQGGADRARGYFRDHFDEAFERYLVPQEGDSIRPSVPNPINTGTSDLFQSVPQEKHGTDVKVQETRTNIDQGTLGHFERGNGHDPHADDLDIPAFLRREPAGARVSSLSVAEIEELRGWAVEFDWRHRDHPEALAQALRERLCNRYDVRPDNLEAEAGRVMDAVFG